jgi:hypothetical protein
VALCAMSFATPLKFFVRNNKDYENTDMSSSEISNLSVNAAVLPTPAVILLMVPQLSIWLNNQH